MSAKNRSVGRDLVSGEVGDGNTNTVIGSGITQRDDSRDINQYFGTNPNHTQNEDIAEIISLALFGNDKIDFKGVVSEVSALKQEIKNLIQQIETLQNASHQRDRSLSDLKSYITQLEKEIVFLKHKNNKWLEYAIYIFIAVGSISSILTLVLSLGY